MNSKITIQRLIATAGVGSFFFDDQAAIKAGAQRDGAAYTGNPQTPGFNSVREPSEAVSVMLLLSDGYVAKGDCASVQYTGVGGREPRFHAKELGMRIEQELAPYLIGRDIRSFRETAVYAERHIDQWFDSKRAAAYGVSQALLDASAHAAGHHVMAQVIRTEWEISAPLAEVPIYGQCGEERYTNVDKMILKQVPVIPHGLINTLDLVGPDGIELEQYIRWLVERVARLRMSTDYLPVIHIDVYGLIGAAAANSIEKVAKIIERLQRASFPHELRIEHPLDAGDRDLQIESLGALRRELKRQRIEVSIIADEWANTAEDVHLFAKSQAVDMVQIKTPDLGSLHNCVDAILDCQRFGVGAVLGGTCAETDVSARATTNVGVATGVLQMLAKPGMGFDEGFNIVKNEMSRILRLAQVISL